VAISGVLPVSLVNSAVPKLGVGWAVLWGLFSFGALPGGSQFPILRPAVGDGSAAYERVLPGSAF
jgi:hypothetical protein